MPMYSAPESYLFVFQLNPENHESIKGTVENIMFELGEVTQEKKQVFFGDGDSKTFGVFVQTAAPLRMLRSRFFRGFNPNDGEPVLQDGDKYFVLEVGHEFDGVGFDEVMGWLQHVR